MEAKIRAKLTCPSCAYVEDVVMPKDSCQSFHECGSCMTFLKPRPGDCCVYCSYADEVCPPKQVASTSTTR